MFLNESRCRTADRREAALLAEGPTGATPAVLHFTNLTRGLLCGVDGPKVRIQSTWCEQKRWGDIITHLGADLLYALAVGSHVVIHDRSEKSRQTRAVWQGLAWIRFACEKGWGLPVIHPFMRNGHNARSYFEEEWLKISRRERKVISYFKPYVVTHEVHLRGCSCS